MGRVSTSDRLKQIMEERNLKQVDILNLSLPICAKYNIKMNKSDISQYVSGKVEPSQEKLVVLGMALNVTESWLMGFDVAAERQKTQSQANANISYEKLIQDAIDLYLQLDSDDQGEIRGEMKQMLKAEKYSTKKPKHA